MNINLIYTALRPSQTAVVHANDDGTYTILVNSNKSKQKQIQGVLHELQHINNDDFYTELQADIIERILHNQQLKEDLDHINFYYHVI